MAVGPLIREVTVVPVGGTKDGTLAIAAPAAGAKIVGVDIKWCSPEFSLTGLVLSNTAATAGTLRYDCAGKSGTNYTAVLTVSDSDVD